jgi:hypothetical protein
MRGLGKGCHHALQSGILHLIDGGNDLHPSRSNDGRVPTGEPVRHVGETLTAYTDLLPQFVEARGSADADKDIVTDGQDLFREILVRVEASERPDSDPGIVERVPDLLAQVGIVLHRTILPAEPASGKGS